MPSPYIRTISGSFNEVYINPLAGESNAKRATQIFPAGGLTKTGFWVPWSLNEDGTPVVPGQGGGSPYFDDVITTTTPGVLQNLITIVVPAGITRYLSQAMVITRVTGIFQVLLNDEIIGSGRTGPGGTGPMMWIPGRAIAAGSTYKVRFQSRAGSPAQDVEAYVQASDTAI